jgi:hypothetical protein
MRLARPGRTALSAPGSVSRQRGFESSQPARRASGPSSSSPRARWAGQPWLRPGWLWCALLVLAAALVLALEMANAALEYLIDEVHPHHAREIGHAKDAAAGAVLLASAAAALIGAMMIASRLL